MKELKFVQTKSNFSLSYIVHQNGTTVYNAEIPLNFKGCKATLYSNGDAIYILSFDMTEELKNYVRAGVSANMLPFAIYSSNHELCGHIFLKRSKSFFGYLYFEFELNNTVYHAYEIGMGKEGIKLTIWKDDKQIALIEKDNVVYDNKDMYSIYAMDEYAIVACIFNLYYDFARFGHYGQAVYKSKQSYYLYTTNKTLKSKYNPSFKNTK